ncbi:T9SS type A sorting domain-containing protein [Flavobacteriales bacterium]|nr:T9SS type A sorting domain-containing protein [Flavobacteriales bacterium]
MKKIIFSILSLRGKLVVKRESFSNRVDISNLKNGIYIIELLNTDSSKEHHQIIKN